MRPRCGCVTDTSETTTRTPPVFTGRKIRQASPMGVALLSVCLPQKTVERQTRSFMTGVGYRGCVGIGYRYDRRDGQVQAARRQRTNQRCVPPVQRSGRYGRRPRVLPGPNGPGPMPIVPRVGRKLMFEGDVLRAFAGREVGSAHDSGLARIGEGSARAPVVRARRPKTDTCVADQRRTDGALRAQVDAFALGSAWGPLADPVA